MMISEGRYFVIILPVFFILQKTMYVHFLLNIYLRALYLHKKLRDSDQTFARGAFTVTKLVFGGDSEMDMGSFFPPSDGGCSVSLKMDAAVAEVQPLLSISVVSKVCQESVFTNFGVDTPVDRFISFIV